MNLNRRGASLPLRFFVGVLLALTACAWLPAATRASETRVWAIDGVKREALVYLPTRKEAKLAPHPLVLVFHGHGGTARHAASTFRIHELWPEAVVVYPQGLPTTGKIVDRDGVQPGWQFAAGEQGDRDLKFFDAILGSLKREGVIDSRQVFVTGHSNGAAFVLLLWLKRNDCIAGYAESAGFLRPPYGALPPAQVLFIAGENDELVKYAWQRGMYDAICQHFACAKPVKNEKGLLVARSNSGAQISLDVHSGSHQFPSEAPQLIVDFFHSIRGKGSKP